MNDFFFLNDEQEDEEYGTNSNQKQASQLAAQIFNTQKKPLDEKVSSTQLWCRVAEKPKVPLGHGFQSARSRLHIDLR